MNRMRRVQPEVPCDGSFSDSSAELNILWFAETQTIWLWRNSFRMLRQEGNVLCKCWSVPWNWEKMCLRKTALEMHVSKEWNWYAPKHGKLIKTELPQNICLLPCVPCKSHQALPIALPHSHANDSQRGCHGVWAGEWEMGEICSTVQLHRNNCPRQSVPAARQQPGNEASQLPDALSGSRSSMTTQEIQPWAQLEEWAGKLCWGSGHPVSPLQVTAGLLSARGSQQERTMNSRKNFHMGPDLCLPDPPLPASGRNKLQAPIAKTKRCPSDTTHTLYAHGLNTAQHFHQDYSHVSRKCVP